LNINYFSCVPPYNQEAAKVALESPLSKTAVGEMVQTFEQRRNEIWEALNKVEGISCRKPGGAFYLFPNISGTGMKSVEFCERLLAEAKVAAVPGIAFGSDDYVRISYATSMENLQQALERVEGFVSSL